MKLFVWLGIFVGGIVGGWIGAVMFDKGNWFGLWSIFLSGVGSLIGIWAGYKLAKNYL